MSKNTVSKPLSKPQQAAAAAILRPHPGALRVIAGAGAGKTATVVSAALEAADAGRPVRVVTFTNAAGAELRSRIARTGGRALADAIAVGTFHSGALRALPQESWSMTNCLDKTVQGTSGRRWGTWALWGALTEEGATDPDLGVAGLKVDGPPQRPQAYALARGLVLAWDAADDLSRLPAHVRRTLPPGFDRLNAAFTKVLHRNRWFTFDDLMLAWLQRLQGGQGRPLAISGGPVPLVIVDEAQDNSWVQHQVAALLCRAAGTTALTARLVLVGDPRQAIHGWRGGDPRPFNGPAADWPAILHIAEPGEEAILTENYRSVPRIVEAGNAISRVCLPASPAMIPISAQDVPAVRAVSASSTVELAALLAKVVVGAAGQLGYGWRDVAVLARTHAELNQLGYELAQHDVPVTGIVAVPDEVRILFAWTRLACGRYKAASVEQAARQPKSYLAKSTIKNLGDTAFNDATSWLLAKGALQEAARKSAGGGQPRAVQRIVDNLERLHRIIGYDGRTPCAPVGEAWHALVDAAADLCEPSWRTAGEGDPGAEERLTGPAWAAAAATLRAGGSLDAATDRMRAALAATVDQDRDGVVMETLHASKGLEWPIVVVMSVPGIWPPGRVRPRASPWLPGVDAEEARLLYVGATRAKRLLLIATASTPAPFLSMPPGAMFDEKACGEMAPLLTAARAALLKLAPELVTKKAARDA